MQFLCLSQERRSQRIFEFCVGNSRARCSCPGCLALLLFKMGMKNKIIFIKMMLYDIS